MTLIRRDCRVSLSTVVQSHDCLLIYGQRFCTPVSFLTLFHLLLKSDVDRPASVAGNSTVCLRSSDRRVDGGREDGKKSKMRVAASVHYRQQLTDCRRRSAHNRQSLHSATISDIDQTRLLLYACYMAAAVATNYRCC